MVKHWPAGAPTVEKALPVCRWFRLLLVFYSQILFLLFALGHFVIHLYPSVVKQVVVSIVLVYVRQTSRVPSAHFDRTGHQQLDHALVSLAMAAQFSLSHHSTASTGLHVGDKLSLWMPQAADAEQTQEDTTTKIKQETTKSNPKPWQSAQEV